MKIIAVLGLWLSVFLAPMFVSEPKPFRIDVNHSNIGFAVPIMGGMSRVSGKFAEFTAELNFDEKDITKSSVNVVIKAKSIITGIAARDEHLRTADFFDVEKFPDITFKSKQVIKKGKTLMLVGDFTMHGVTKEIRFPFTITGKDIDKKENLVTYGFSAKTVINRRDFNIDYQHDTVPNFIGDNVEIEISLLTRPNKL